MITIPKVINVDKTGVEMFIGSLEAAIMRAVWDRRITTRAIYNHVRNNYTPIHSTDIAFTSITSTVDRLTKRGLLQRSGTRNGYTYMATTTSEAEFIQLCLTRTLTALLDTYPRESGKIIVAHANKGGSNVK